MKLMKRILDTLRGNPNYSFTSEGEPIHDESKEEIIPDKVVYRKLVIENEKRHQPIIIKLSEVNGFVRGVEIP